MEHSVTHSGDLVAVAVATAPVGVDVEQLDRRWHGQGDAEALTPRVLALREQAVLAATPLAARGRRFLIAWTRKAAVTKAIGEGLRASLRDVIVAADTGAPRLVSWPYPQPPGGVSLHDLDPGTGYVAALAVIGPCGLVRTRDGSALLAASAG